MEYLGFFDFVVDSIFRVIKFIIGEHFAFDCICLIYAQRTHTLTRLWEEVFFLHLFSVAQIFFKNFSCRAWIVRSPTKRRLRRSFTSREKQSKQKFAIRTGFPTDWIMLRPGASGYDFPFQRKPQETEIEQPYCIRHF